MCSSSAARPTASSWTSSQREFPELLPRYRALYGGGSAATSAYRDRIERLATRASLEAGFPGRSRTDRMAAERPARPRQLLLEW